MQKDTIQNSSHVLEVDVIIEIPLECGKVKYEIKIENNISKISVDRFSGTDMVYPCNYGFIPNTLGLDGDPIDALVITPMSLVTGSWIKTRPLGALLMEDDGGIDHKVILVPTRKITKAYDEIHSIDDLPHNILNRIVHFFSHYKDLEDGKWVNIKGWSGVADAVAILEDGFSRFQKFANEVDTAEHKHI